MCHSFYVLGMTNGQCSLADCIQFVLPRDFYECDFYPLFPWCWLFSLLETHFFCILMKRKSHIFSRALQKSTLESSYTYVVKAWKMNSDVIYHKEPGWCSVSICCCQELKESSKNSYRCSMTFKNKVHYGPEYIKWFCVPVDVGAEIVSSSSNSIYSPRGEAGAK